MAALCPKCDKTISQLRLETLSSVIGGTSYKTVAYVCPHCRAMISASIDPIALCGDIARAVKKELGQ